MYTRVHDDVSGTAAGIVMVALIAAIVVICVVIGAMIIELIRIFRARAFQRTTTASILWIGLCVLFLIWLAAGFLGGDPNLGEPMIYTAAWAFLLFVILAEALDWYERQREPEFLTLSTAGLLDVAPQAATSNGHGQVEWDDLLREGVVVGENLPVA